MENQNQKQIEKTKSKYLGGIGIKLLFISLIIIALLIGLGFIKGQLSDREYTYKNAKNQISESAGSNLYFKGPYIAIPYTRTIEEFVYRDGKQFKETKIAEEGWHIISSIPSNSSIIRICHRV